jgi:flagellar biosynthetic protein FlhB
MAGEEDDSSKTEEPTQRKLEEARKRGEVVTSRELNHLFMFLAAALFLFLMAGPAAKSIGAGLQAYILHSHDIVSPGVALWQGLVVVFKALALPFLLFIIAAAAGTLLQIGPMWATDHLMPKLERISILQGVSRLFSKRSVLELLKGMIKISVVAILVTWLVWPSLGGLEHMADSPVPLLLDELSSLALRVVGGVVALMLVIALLDYLIQRLMFLQRMRMTRTELKEEFKQTEGDPQIKQRIRQIRMERARRRMMAEVPKADVVVTNPDHYAIALKYDPATNAAPIVVAMGMDRIALKIKEIAREHDIPLVENPPLARALYASADLDKEIPAEHYRAVAEIISYVFKLKNKAMPRPGPR